MIIHISWILICYLLLALFFLFYAQFMEGGTKTPVTLETQKRKNGPAEKWSI